MNAMDDRTRSAEVALDADDPDLWSWLLAVLLWAECLVAVVASLRSPSAEGGGGVWPLGLALYAVVLAVAAVARSGPLGWMRPVTWLALAAVAVVHGVAWVAPPGPLSFRVGELLTYAGLLAAAAVLAARERRLPPDSALWGWPRRMEVTARSLGLGFSAGVLLLFVDALVKLPFSGH